MKVKPDFWNFENVETADVALIVTGILLIAVLLWFVP